MVTSNLLRVRQSASNRFDYRSFAVKVNESFLLRVPEDGREDCRAEVLSYVWGSLARMKKMALRRKQGQSKRLELLLKPAHSFGLRSFRSLDYLKFDGLALLERFISILHYSRIVHEHIGTTRLLDEPIALR